MRQIKLATHQLLGTCSLSYRISTYIILILASQFSFVLMHILNNSWCDWEYTHILQCLSCKIWKKILLSWEEGNTLLFWFFPVQNLMSDRNRFLPIEMQPCEPSFELWRCSCHQHDKFHWGPSISIVVVWAWNALLVSVRTSNKSGISITTKNSAVQVIIWLPAIHDTEYYADMWLPVLLVHCCDNVSLVFNACIFNNN